MVYYDSVRTYTVPYDWFGHTHDEAKGEPPFNELDNHRIWSFFGF